MSATMQTVDELLSTLGGGPSKKADDHAGKSPESDPAKDTGGACSPTAHPSGKAPDMTEKGREGEHGKQNEKDVKEQQGPTTPDATPDAVAKKVAGARDLLNRLTKKSDDAVQTPGSAAQDAAPVRAKVTPTGGDPKNETAGVDATKKDTGGVEGPSKHPARTDNSELNGGKYSSLNENSSLSDLLRGVKEAGDHLLSVCIMADRPKVAGAAPTAPSAPAEKTLSPAQMNQVGWEFAAMLNGTMDKAAADKMVEESIEGQILDGYGWGLKVADHLDYLQAQAKKAEDAPPPPPDGGGGGGGMDPALMAAMGGGGGAGGPPPGGGGPPPMMPGGGGGAPPGGGGAVPVQQEAQDIEQILEAAGITPEMIMQAQQAAQGGGGGGAGGPPPGAGAGGPPADAGAPPPPPGGDSAKAGSVQGESKYAFSRGYINELLSRKPRAA